MITILITLLWLILGCFICYKANWFNAYRDNVDSNLNGCIFTIIFSPLVFIWDIFNRIFIQKWH